MRVFSFFGSKTTPPATKGNEADRLVATLAARADAATRQSYFSYLVALFRRTSPYALWQRARTAFAPAIFLSRALRILRIFLRVLEASALFLFAAALLFFITPFLLLAALATILYAAVTARRTDRRLAPMIQDRRVLVLFSPAVTDPPARALSDLFPQYTVLVVLPLWGDAGRRLSPFETARRDRGVILLREHYYFHLAKRILPRAASVARIY